MRRQLDARVTAQRVVERWGFDREHVQCRRPEPTAVQGGEQGRGIDEFTAGDVHEEGARSHPGEQRRVDHAAGLRSQRCVQGEHVGGGDQLVQAQPLDTVGPPCPVGVRVVRGDAAEDGGRDPGQGPRDAPEAQQSERQLTGPARDFGELGVPSAAAHGGVGLGQRAHQAERAGERMHGDVLGRGMRKVAHPQSASPRLGRVDHVVAGGHGGQHPHTGEAVEQPGIHGRVADDQRDGVTRDGGDRVRVATADDARVESRVGQQPCARTDVEFLGVREHHQGPAHPILLKFLRAPRNDDSFATLAQNLRFIRQNCPEIVMRSSMAHTIRVRPPHPRGRQWTPPRALPPGQSSRGEALRWIWTTPIWPSSANCRRTAA